MDRSADLEMPSPKRIRLEAPKPEATSDPATPVDDIDDLYGTPPMQFHFLSRSSHVPAPAPDTPATQINQKLFHLPGLGMLDESTTSPTQISQQQSQASSFPEAEQSSSAANVEDMELDGRQKLQVNGGQEPLVEDELVAHIETAKPEHTSPIASEMLVDGDDTAIVMLEERVSEAEAPIGPDVTGSELAQTTLDWHSSGTFIDRGIWLGGYCIDNAPSTVPDLHITLNWHSSGTVIDNGIWMGGYPIDKVPSTAPGSDTARARTNAEVSQERDVDQVSDDLPKQFISGPKLAAQRSEKTDEKLAFEDLAEEAKEDTEEAEFELDSSPLDSDSSSDDSTDTSSSDDSDADDYEMLSPAEQARRLMAEDGGSDGDGKGKGPRTTAEVPRTTNEKPDEIVPRPTVTVTEDMKIEELGFVENIVENLALIKANTSGEYQVLESGSLLCLQDRSAIGVVSETLGRVQQPYYSVHFTNGTEIAEAGIEKGIKIFYVAQHSTSVFTQPLKAVKGSDASNLHDEEIADDELEFSDDEAEAEHKRQIKQQRIAKRDARDGQPDGYSRGPQRRPGGSGLRFNSGLHPVQEHPPASAEAVLNYDDADGMNVDDNEDEDGLYTPLTRPSNLHEILSGKAPPVNNHRGRGNATRYRGDSRGGNRGNNRGSNRGRGSNRSRGGDRGMRDSERGGNTNRIDHRNREESLQAYGPPVPPSPQSSGFSTPNSNGLPPRPTPKAIDYQRSTHQGIGFVYPTPLQSPVPSRTYQNHHQQQQPQSHTHPGYPSQYSNAYNQYCVQRPPHHPHPSPVPQHNCSQYHQPPHQPIPHQGYPQPFASQPDVSFALPRPQYPAPIPPGAHINPNYFKQQGQASSPQAWQPGNNQQQHLASPASSYPSHTGPPAPKEADLEELLRGLDQGGDWS